MVSLEIDADDLAEGLRVLNGELEHELREAAVESGALLERETRALAPKVTHALERSIHAVPPEGTLSAGTLQGGIDVDAEHALSVHDGSRPHTIEAVRARALRFTVNGRPVFARRVQHPGTRGYPFAELALELRAPEIEGAIGNHFDAAMQRAGFGR